MSRPMYTVDETTGCWVWKRRPDTHGYAQLWRDGRRHLAHRVFYEAMRGPIPEGLELDHLCQNRACVNPAHMEPVTHAENSRRANHAKALTADAVAAIRAAYAAGGITQQQLATEHGVSRPTISEVVTGRTWRRPSSNLATARA